MHHPDELRVGHRWRRMALLPTDADVNAQDLLEQLSAGGPEFAEALRDLGLAAAWHSAVDTPDLKRQLPESTVQLLQRARIEATARYMAQQGALHELDRVFEDAGIAYALMKGVAIREVLFDDPSVLQASDLDVLVAPADRVRAVALLVQAGYTMHLDSGNISHEVTLQSPIADIDLHWNILRPGRTRIDLTAELLSRRVRVNGFWALSRMDSTFIMLTHPAFAKYVCSPNMGLARVLSFLLWIQKVDCDWNGVVELLERTGLNAAAWTMLGWYTACAPAALVPVLSRLRAPLRPSRLRAAYLEFWLRHDLPTRFINRPVFIQFGLTAFLHDGAGDALLAYKGWYLARRDRMRQAAAFYVHPGMPA